MMMIQITAIGRLLTAIRIELIVPFHVWSLEMFQLFAPSNEMPLFVSSMLPFWFQEYIQYENASEYQFQWRNWNPLWNSFPIHIYRFSIISHTASINATVKTYPHFRLVSCSSICPIVRNYNGNSIYYWYRCQPTDFVTSSSESKSRRFVVVR